MIDLIAIRARDADYNDVFEAQASMSKDIAHRLVAWPVADRRALLAAYDALAAENAALRKAVKGFLDDYVSADGMYDTKYYAREFLSAMEQSHD